MNLQTAPATAPFSSELPVSIKFTQVRTCLSHVEIVSRTDPDGSSRRFVVTPYFIGVDRAEGTGISTGGDLGLAMRVQECMLAYGDPRRQSCIQQAKPAVDANGKSYIAFTLTLMGRRLNADLKRLGF